ncbi:hypothetical protein JY97_00670 [Alkalispirochaeta odontotermitis]|nr:hypothetical protein JY97_00670 [Alkalispirochaeta odontotermitis]
MTDEIQLIEQAKKLGIPVNPEWSEKYLKRQITIAENAKAKADQKAQEDLARLNEAEKAIQAHAQEKLALEREASKVEAAAEEEAGGAAEQVRQRYEAELNKLRDSLTQKEYELRHLQKDAKETYQDASESSLAATGKKEVLIRLLKNYVPKDSVLENGKVNRDYVPKYAENGKVEGQYPGVGQQNKIWAGSKVWLPIDEARGLVERRLAEIPADALGL